jgi:CheY-like chemotaxis protein
VGITLEQEETLSAEKLVLHIEDDADARQQLSRTTNRYNLKLLAVTSVAEVWGLLEDEDFRFGVAFVDQLLPQDPAGSIWAEEDEVYELACRLAERGPIVWLTGHDVKARQMEIANCLGTVPKSGDTTGKIAAYLEEAIDDLQAKIVFDEVLVELSDLRPNTVNARVPTWRPSETFTIKTQRLDPWIIAAVRDGKGSAYFRARAWLGAERHGQLDLTDWHLIPPSTASDESFWDETD